MMLVLVLLCAPMLWAQQGGSDSSSSGDDQSTDQSPSSPGPKVAFTHPDALPPLALLSEAAASTGVTLGVNSTMVVDTNGGGFGSNAHAQTFFSFQPNINILQYRSKTFWSFYYSGGLEFDPQLPRQNLFSNNAHLEFLHQLNSRWQVHVKDTYVYTANPYAAYETFHGAPAPNNPNPTIYLPNGIIESNMGNITLTRLMGAHDSITFGGGESFRRYYDVPQSTLNTYSYAGYSYYQHDFSARLAAGVGYSFTALDFGHGESRHPDGHGVRTIPVQQPLEWGPLDRPAVHHHQGHRSCHHLPALLLSAGRAQQDLRCGGGPERNLRGREERLPPQADPSDHGWRRPVGRGAAVPGQRGLHPRH
jgi:hypothetical protein